jgi:hypothetical protein
MTKRSRPRAKPEALSSAGPPRPTRHAPEDLSRRAQTDDAVVLLTSSALGNPPPAQRRTFPASSER